MKRMFRGTVILMGASVLALGLFQTAVAYPLPSPPVFWDCGGHAPSDSCVFGWKAGTGWTPGRSARFTDSFGNWSSLTQFDPKTSTSGQPVYVDRNGCVSDWTPAPGLVILAAVCISKVYQSAFDYYKLTATPTYMNPNLEEVGLSWFNSAGAPGANQIHFGGTLTHELGHWVFLNDLNCAPGVTMCHSTQSEQDVFDQFSLEQEDINAANAIY